MDGGVDTIDQLLKRNESAELWQQGRHTKLGAIDCSGLLTIRQASDALKAQANTVFGGRGGWMPGLLQEEMKV